MRANPWAMVPPPPTAADTSGAGLSSAADGGGGGSDGGGGGDGREHLDHHVQLLQKLLALQEANPDDADVAAQISAAKSILRTAVHVQPHAATAATAAGDASPAASTSAASAQPPGAAACANPWVSLPPSVGSGGPGAAVEALAPVRAAPANPWGDDDEARGDGDVAAAAAAATGGTVSPGRTLTWAEGLARATADADAASAAAGGVVTAGRSSTGAGAGAGAGAGGADGRLRHPSDAWEEERRHSADRAARGSVDFSSDFLAHSLLASVTGASVAAAGGAAVESEAAAAARVAAAAAALVAGPPPPNAPASSDEPADESRRSSASSAAAAPSAPSAAAAATPSLLGGPATFCSGGRSAVLSTHETIVASMVMSDYFDEARPVAATLRRAWQLHAASGGLMAVRRVAVVHSLMREDRRMSDSGRGVVSTGKLITVYLVRARVGPFECTTTHRFSDFVRLCRALQAAFSKLKPWPPSAAKLNAERRNLQPHRHIEARMRLLQKFCDDMCARHELGGSKLMVSFFWPSAERGDGDGSVVAPDGSRASML